MAEAQPKGEKKINRTSIEWVKNPDGTQGYTWNPITGCLNGCEYCYARKLANGRLRERYLANANVADITRRLRDPNSSLWDKVATDPFYPRFWEDRLYEPCHIEKPVGIFAVDMGDLFGGWIPEHWQNLIFSVIESMPQHRFYLLTKQPQNLIKFSPFPDNCWVGVTATNADMLFDALNHLDEIQTSKRFISIEPMLASCHLVDLSAHLTGTLDWLIIGSQTRPYKPPKIGWVREIVEAADKAGIPVFLKDNLKPLLTAGKLNGVDVIESHNLWAFRELKLRQEMPI